MANKKSEKQFCWLCNSSDFAGGYISFGNEILNRKCLEKISRHKGFLRKLRKARKEVKNND
jgi:hypothetical protein